MSTQQTTLLCHYHYDPLDRLINQSLLETPTLQRFYCKSRLATEIQGAVQHSIVQHGDQLLAQQRREGDEFGNTLLATDQQRSVLSSLDKESPNQFIAYLPYGHRRQESGLISLLGFAGERPDPVTGHYLLGNGYRAFNPVLMRFNSPDNLSPFEKGGLNSYAYCLGDPINLNDTDGHSPTAIAFFHRWRLITKARIAARAEEQLVKATNSVKTNKLEILVPKSSVTPRKALQARDTIDRLDDLGGLKRAQEMKYLNDLSVAKKESKLIQQVTGIPASENERLKMLNYLKGGATNSQIYSTSRLHRPIDPKVSLAKQPSENSLVGYRNEMEPLSNQYDGNRKIYRKEAMRIRSLYFESKI